MIDMKEKHKHYDGHEGEAYLKSLYNGLIILILYYNVRIKEESMSRLSMIRQGTEGLHLPSAQCSTIPVELCIVYVILH